MDEVKVIGSFATNDTTNTAGLVAINNGTISKTSVSGDIISCGTHTAGIVAVNNGTLDTIITTTYNDNVEVLSNVAGYE